MLKKALSVVAMSSVMLASGAFASSVMFSDVAADHWANDAIMWNNESGIMMGKDGMFRPADNVTRAELAVVTQRLYQMMNPMNELTVQPMTYRVTLTNVSDYTVSPGLLVVHQEGVSANFATMTVGAEGGAPASLEALAEGGDATALKADLMAMTGVDEVISIEPIPAGESREVMVTMPEREGMVRVSFLGMVVESNDTYTFFESDLADMEAAPSMNLDAGTEVNAALASGCEGGQPAADCTNMGEAEATNQAIAASEQLAEGVLEVAIMKTVEAAM